MNFRERFAPYSDDIFAVYNGEKDSIVQVFNATEVYLRALHVMDYTRVGISVVPRLLFPEYEEGRFMSLHEPLTREVVDLVDWYSEDEPDLIVRATSNGLTSILQDGDWVIQPKNYLSAVLKYGPLGSNPVFAPGPRPKDKVQLVKLVGKIHKILRPQPPRQLRP